AIFIGGTGLYFKALMEGISAMPEPDPQVRAHWRAIALSAPESLHGELARRDPAGAALLEPADRQRLVRALEVFDSTGLPISHFQAQGAREGVLEGARVERYLVEPERSELHARIARRFDAMLAAGAVAEVQKLAARGLDPLLPAMKAHGVPWLRRHLAGELSFAAAAAEGKRDTRHYAKRQATWFRHQMKGWAWVEPARAEQEVIARLSLTR
ncbi:MAG: tRNA (adenosine(37)-N6)-dimethylallyltransferase, partial [Xanthobacteraceae bacterium]